MRTDTMFWKGSMSKAILATALIILVDVNDPSGKC